ncbi:MAG: DUF1549 domain-containing protein, partial [Planctomycetota bacterium]
MAVAFIGLVVSLLAIEAAENNGFPFYGACAASDRRAHAEEHWAFQPIRRPRLPAIQAPQRARHPIDRFVLARLETLGVAPALPADLATLRRRVTLDLIGLLPTTDVFETRAETIHPIDSPESLDFCDASDAIAQPDAIDRVIDRLLASPAYGERWARPWLDLSH